MTASSVSHARRWLGATALGMASLLGGCVVAPVSPGPTYTTYGDPPPVRYEVVPVSPYPAYVWTPGIWMWGGARYNWRPGYWGPPHHHGWGGGPRWRGRY
jgi:hypothetical protein